MIVRASISASRYSSYVRSFVALAGLAGLVGLAAACGGSGDDSQPDDAPPAVVPVVHADAAVAVVPPPPPPPKPGRDFIADVKLLYRVAACGGAYNADGTPAPLPDAITHGDAV